MAGKMKSRSLDISQIEQIGPYTYEISADYREDMQAPARLFADAAILDAATADRSLEQLVNTACLPGIVRYAMAMPDVHQGYGFPIGGVAATAAPNGVISPGGVGYDINCGVRLLGTHLIQEEIQPHLEDLVTTLNTHCPSGVGKGGALKLKTKELHQVLEQGSRWALKRGMATPSDLERTEGGGCLTGAMAGCVSDRALERGRGQIGTLGAGNHFIEVDRVDEIFDANAADRMGLVPDGIVVQIHCGSRGLGHQVCSDYVKRFQKVIHTYGLRLPDRELVCAPLNSPEGQDYLAAMTAAANYAFVNRQVLTHAVRRAFEQALASHVTNHHVYQIYDIAHNMARIETHQVEGHTRELCVHRKGATRAFGPGSPELPPVYRDIGQPVLVPGSMGTCSWVLRGTESAMRETFGSTCHGAGRRLSRRQARKRFKGARMRQDLERSGIHVRAGSMPGLAEEAPKAYKDVDRVVEVVHGARIAQKVARLVPLAVIKG